MKQKTILTLKRINLTNAYTEGELFIDDSYFCNTLEDPNRDYNKNGKFDNGEYKIYNNTCIPFGTYKVQVTYSPRFKRNLPILLDVPEFTGIRIHRGNTVKDTSGCILVGNKSNNGIIRDSTNTEIKLVKKLEELQNNNSEILIKIM